MWQYQIWQEYGKTELLRNCWWEYKWHRHTGKYLGTFHFFSFFLSLFLYFFFFKEVGSCCVVYDKLKLLSSSDHLTSAFPVADHTGAFQSQAMEIFLKNYMSIMHPNTPIPSHLSQSNENLYLHKNVHTSTYSCFCCNNPKLQITLISFKLWCIHAMEYYSVIKIKMNGLLTHSENRDES